MRRSSERQPAQRLNTIIDSGLHGRRLPVALLLRISGDPQKFAERVRHRAARLIRLSPQRAGLTLAERDRLIGAVYARAAGTQRVAWCDASWRPGSGLIGAAALVAGRRGKVLWSVQKHSRAEADAVAAEAWAVTLAVQSILDRAGQSLTAYSDCRALVELWYKRRHDPRLHELRKAAGKIRIFRLRLIKRSHNQPAHRLARAMLKAGESEMERR